jgi:hypothetical protein
MGHKTNYWRRYQPDGRINASESDQARSWFEKYFSDFSDALSSSEDRAIQRRLMEMRANEMGSEEEDRRMAEHCLYCFIFHQLMAACTDLETRFGEKGRFTRHDLFSLLQNSSLCSKILKSFNVEKGGLSRWTKTHVMHHKDVDNFLKECGIYRDTDWALLNDINKITKFKKILSHSGIEIAPDEAVFWSLIEKYYDIYYNKLLLERNRLGNLSSFPTEQQLEQMVAEVQKILSPYLVNDLRFLPVELMLLNDVNVTQNKIKIEQTVRQYCKLYKPSFEKIYEFWDLLNSYYDVYRKDHLENSTPPKKSPKKCPEPTNEQLQRITDEMQLRGYLNYHPKIISDNLSILSEATRQYKKKIVGKNGSITESYPSENQPDVDFLDISKSEFLEYLNEAIKQIIINRIPIKQNQYCRFLQAHYMFYCENRTQAEIARALSVSPRTIAEDIKPEQHIINVCHTIIKMLCFRPVVFFTFMLVQEINIKVSILLFFQPPTYKYYDLDRLQHTNNKIREAIIEIIKPRFDRAIAELYTPAKSSNISLIKYHTCYNVKKMMGDLE